MILDYIDNIQLSDDRVKAYYNELHSPGYLAQGLSFLYEQVQRLEAKVIEQIPSNQKVFLFGNAPELSSVPQSLVACAFHYMASLKASLKVLSIVHYRPLFSPKIFLSRTKS